MRRGAAQGNPHSRLLARGLSQAAAATIAAVTPSASTALESASTSREAGGVRRCSDPAMQWSLRRPERAMSRTTHAESSATMMNAAPSTLAQRRPSSPTTTMENAVRFHASAEGEEHPDRDDDDGDALAQRGRPAAQREGLERDARRDEGERGADPREVGTLIREGEARVRLLPVGEKPLS